MRWILVVAVLGGCSFPTPSEDYACHVTPDCESGRTCTNGYCVIASGGAGVDAPKTPADAAASDAALDADPFAATALQCMTAGYTAVPAAGSSYYRVVASSTSWVNAETDCANDVVGATHLVVLSSQAEATYVGTQTGWIGLTDRITEGTFVNVTNEANDLRPWASGQPDNGGGNENCVQAKTGGQIDDDQCNNNHRYVCECDGHVPTP